MSKKESLETKEWLSAMDVGAVIGIDRHRARRLILAGKFGEFRVMKSERNKVCAHVHRDAVLAIANQGGKHGKL